MTNFAKVEDPSHLIFTVKERLPASSVVYNQLRSYDKLKSDMDILVYGENTPEKSIWVITRYYRDDRGPWISISPPTQEDSDGGVPEEVKQSLISGEIFNWINEDYVLTSPIHISKFILNLNLDELGHIIRVNPCYVFHIKPEDALELEVSPPPGTQVKPLDPDTGTPFIANNWEYNRKRTHVTVRKCIESLHSGGLYLDGQKSPVCGAITGGFGLINMLHTMREHRRKGYASLVMRFIFQEMAKDGLQPVLISEMDNKAAVNFHHSLGLRQVSKMTIMTRGNN